MARVEDLLNKPLTRRGFLVGAGATLVGLGTAAMCGGAEKKANPVQTPPGLGKATRVPQTPTQEATATLVPPTETPKPKLKRLAEAPFKPTTFNDMVKSIDDAYVAHTDIAQVGVFGGSSVSRESQDNNINFCHNGDPAHYSNPKLVPTDRMISCANMTDIWMDIYRQTGYEELYQAAVDTANYFLTELPGKKADFDGLLDSVIHDSSPSLEK